MRTLINWMIVLISVPLFGQETVRATDDFTVTGLVEKELVIGATLILALPSRPIPDVAITRNAGELRGTAKGLRGVRMKDLLAHVSVEPESPRVLSEFYFTFIAADGYNVVYSLERVVQLPKWGYLLSGDRKGRTGAHGYF